VGTSRSKIKNVGIDMKGIFYSIMISLMLIPILALIIFYSHSSQMRDIDIDIRANELEYFTKSIEKDLSRFIEINGKRSLIAAVSKMVVNKSFVLDDAQMRLSEMIENGTLYGEPAPLVDASNLETWKGKIEDMADRTGFNVEFKDIQIDVTQNDSFNISFDINMTINISDKTEVMGVIKNVTAFVLVSIEGIEDPTFPLNTLGRVVRFIRASNVSKKTEPLVTGTNASGSISGNATLSEADTGSDKILIIDSLVNVDNPLNFGGVVAESSVIPDGYTGIYIVGATDATLKIETGKRIYLDYSKMKVWDLSNLTLDITNGYYHNSTNGASFLDRLEGNITLSQKYYPYGLETFVYLPHLSSANVPVDYSLSVLDHKYWNDIAGSIIRNGGYDNVFNWFKIDQDSANNYGINELRT
jgi:hypothetical protein